MARQPRIGDEVRQLKGLLAGLSLDTKLLRLEQVLRRKEWSEQPRAPAGQPNGGQWVGDGGGNGGTVDPDVLRLIRPQWAQMPAVEAAQTRDETRLDQFHSPQPTAAFVYDDKAGLRGLSWSDWVRYATRSKTYFPATQRIIVIQMRESR